MNILIWMFFVSATLKMVVRFIGLATLDFPYKLETTQSEYVTSTVFEMIFSVLFGLILLGVIK